MWILKEWWVSWQLLTCCIHSCLLFKRYNYMFWANH
jgi:hypothetical protein